MSVYAKPALEAFVDAIDSTGGITTECGYAVPNADPAWIDLGNAYLLACSALGRKPKYNTETEVIV